MRKIFFGELATGKSKTIVNVWRDKKRRKFKLQRVGNFIRKFVLCFIFALSFNLNFHEKGEF